MCNTYLMQIGLAGVVLSDFKFLGLAQVVYLVFTVVLGIMRIVRYPKSLAKGRGTQLLTLTPVPISSLSQMRFEEGRDDPDLDLWDMPGFQVVFVLQNLAAGLYYHQVLYSTFRLADAKYYSKP